MGSPFPARSGAGPAGPPAVAPARSPGAWAASPGRFDVIRAVCCRDMPLHFLIGAITTGNALAIGLGLVKRRVRLEKQAVDVVIAVGEGHAGAGPDVHRNGGDDQGRARSATIRP